MTEPSDLRLKKNITTFTPKRINVNWVTFQWRDEEFKIELGAVAQRLEIDYPEFVVTDPETQMKAIKYTQLLIAKVAELEHRIKLLELNNT